jgi:hypothetical protein
MTDAEAIGQARVAFQEVFGHELERQGHVIENIHDQITIMRNNPLTEDGKNVLRNEIKVAVNEVTWAAIREHRMDCPAIKSETKLHGDVSKIKTQRDYVIGGSLVIGWIITVFFAVYEFLSKRHP